MDFSSHFHAAQTWLRSQPPGFVFWAGWVAAFIFAIILRAIFVILGVILFGTKKKETPQPEPEETEEQHIQVELSDDVAEFFREKFDGLQNLILKEAKWGERFVEAAKQHSEALQNQTAGIQTTVKEVIREMLPKSKARAQFAPVEPAESPLANCPLYYPDVLRKIALFADGDEDVDDFLNETAEERGLEPDDYKTFRALAEAIVSKLREPASV